MIAESETTTRHAQETRKLDIEFLFLDLNRCTRCVGTNENLERALKSVQQVLDLASIELETHKILVDSPEKAQVDRFSLSPTIRVNGNDIALETILTHSMTTTNFERGCIRSLGIQSSITTASTSL